MYDMEIPFPWLWSIRCTSTFLDACTYILDVQTLSLVGRLLHMHTLLCGNLMGQAILCGTVGAIDVEGSVGWATNGSLSVLFFRWWAASNQCLRWWSQSLPSTASLGVGQWCLAVLEEPQHSSWQSTSTEWVGGHAFALQCTRSDSLAGVSQNFHFFYQDANILLVDLTDFHYWLSSLHNVIHCWN